MLIACLIVLNLPVYLLIGWLLFDDADNPSRSVLGTIGMVLYNAVAFSAPSYRHPERGNLVLWMHQVAFYLGCICITGGEWYAITKWLLPAVEQWFPFSVTQ